MEIIIWIIFAIGCLMSLFLSRFIRCQYMDRPLWMTKSNMGHFNLIRLVVVWIAIFSLLWKYDFSIFLVVAISYVIFVRVSIWYFGRKVFAKLTQDWVGILSEDAREAGEEIVQEVILREAIIRAKTTMENS